MITVTLTEKEILATPNAYELGELVHHRYWSQKEPKPSDLPKVNNQPELPFPLYDRCVVCGAESPYTQGHHIDYRIGYVEGAGQGCFQPSECAK